MQLWANAVPGAPIAASIVANGIAYSNRRGDRLRFGQTGPAAGCAEAGGFAAVPIGNIPVFAMQRRLKRIFQSESSSLKKHV